MKKVTLKALNDSSIQIRYDKNLDLYAINVISNQGNNESHNDLTKEKTLALLQEHTNVQLDPMLSVVQKAIAKGIDPTSILNVS